METFAPGDRVLAINTDMSGPVYGSSNPDLHPFLFPDGPLRSGVVYHVVAVELSGDGHQGLRITGLRVLWGPHEITWSATRFRKVDTLSNHIPKKRRRKQPILACVS